MIEQIRKATWQAHADLDHSVYPIIQSVHTKEQYRRLLHVFYGYFQPVYEKLDIFIDKTILRDYNLRRRPSILLDDLMILGHPPKSIDICPRLPSIESVPHAFGAMYVLEGSTMGGKIIAKKLIENTGLPEICFRFFSAYGEYNAQMWGLFAESLQHRRLEDFSSDITRTAVDTFQHFHEWIGLHYPAAQPIQKEFSQA